MRGTTVMSFKSYPHSLSQFVAYNGHNSIKLPITCGVPHGSILGPLLFLIFINDNANISDILHYNIILQLILFADDTKLFAFHRDQKIEWYSRFTNVKGSTATDNAILCENGWTRAWGVGS